MTTRDFITKAFNGQTRATKCSSVFVDGGAVYSYGYHYPLLFRVNGKAIRNVSGYSPTTGRHIMWSRDVNAIDVHAGRNFRLRGTDTDVMADLVNAQKAYVQSQRDRITNHRARGRREDTQLFANIVRELDRAIADLAELEA